SISEVANLSSYGDITSNIAWDRSGRLASVSIDGKLRLYDTSFKLIQETAALAGKQPYSLAFSPNGELLAVGYTDSPQVQVFDAKSLKLLYEPDISGADDVNKLLNKVSFSSSGNQLIAGGTYRKALDGKWWYMLRIWDNRGRGTYRDIAAGKNTIMDIKALPDNGIAFGGAYPDWGVFDSGGNKQIYKAAETNNYSAKDKTHLRVSPTGQKIGITPFQGNAISFDIEKRSLEDSPFSSGKQHSEKRHSLKVTDWANSLSPKLNGKALSFLSANEWSFAVDITMDGQRLLFGSNLNLHSLDTSGNKLWSTYTQATTLCVNITDNGKAAIAGMSDGIIRWYRMQDGKHLLSLYLHPDGNRWLLWTPQGYYDCSVGAEDLIGWHLNQGADREALYFPASRFRDRYYRPDVIDNILVTYDEDSALRLANMDNNRKESETPITKILPPVVRIISPVHNQGFDKEQVTIEYSATSPGGEPILGVRFLIDGRPVENERGLIPAGSKGAMRKSLNLPPRDVSISIVAENKHGWSSPSEVRMQWIGQSFTPDVLKPTLYLLAIGVSDYQKPDYKLGFASKDARDFSAVLQRQKGGLYRDVVVRTLTDKDANKDNILDALEWIQNETTGRDIAIIFLAGHGINDNNNVFYYMPYEADLESIRRTCLKFTELKDTVSSIAGKVLMFVDACHSGNVWGGRRALPDVNILVNELSDAESGAIVFTSSTGRQFSLEDSKWGNGAFTKALIEGINGQADLFGKGTITVKTLDAFIAQRVKELTGGKQSPTAIIPNSIPDFPIGIKR
ncbi:MAG: caspase family protein, partial [Candidatus Cloacimonetes bacterium]|nr:caspase family protein [Candidatus Cloacimonadota bacterium]